MVFINDKRGRIPFAVLGVFLLIGSAVTSGVITGLDREHSKEIGIFMLPEKEKYIVQYVEADLARAIDYAGKKSFREVGETPVHDASGCEIPCFKTDTKNIEPKPGKDYVIVNLNRARFRILDQFRDYVNASYSRDSYVVDNYVVNVVVPSEWDEVIETIIQMKLHRIVDNPLMPIGNKDGDKDYNTYVELGIPVTFEIKNLSNGKILRTTKTVISSLISSRYLLLEGVTDDFEHRIGGDAGDFGGVTRPLGISATAALYALTWVRGYLQFFTTIPANIISSDWLKIVTTSGILLEEGFVFNTIDPMGYLYVGMETANTVLYDLTGQHLDDVIPTGKVDELKNQMREGLSTIGSITNIVEKKAEDIIKNMEDGEEKWQEFSSPHKITLEIDKIAEEELSETLNQIPDYIGKTYLADIYTSTEREITDNNRNEINQALNNKKTDSENLEKEREADAMLSANPVPPDFDIPVSAAPVSSSITENAPFPKKGDWVLNSKQDISQNIDFFDNSNQDSIVIDGEKWRIKRSREEEYGWDIETTWNVVMSNGTSTRTTSVTLSSHYSYEPTYWQEEDVTIYFKSDKYSYGYGDGNDLMQPFYPKSLTGVVTQPRKDSNLDGSLSYYLQLINWESFAREDLLRGNDQKYTVSKTIKSTEEQPFHDDWLVDEIVLMLDGVKQQISNDDELDISREIGALSRIMPDELTSDIIEKMRDKFYNKMDDFKGKQMYFKSGKYISAAAKAIYSIRDRYIENIFKYLDDAVKNKKGDEDIKDGFSDAQDEHKTETTSDSEDSATDQKYDDTKSIVKDGRQLEGEEFQTDPLELNLVNVFDDEWQEKIVFSLNQIPHFIGKDYYADYYKNADANGVSLSYTNVNIFSPLAGIDNLVDEGFEALNNQVLDAIDETFDKIDAELQEGLKGKADELAQTTIDAVKEQLKSELKSKEGWWIFENKKLDELSDDEIDASVDDALSGFSDRDVIKLLKGEKLVKNGEITPKNAEERIIDELEKTVDSKFDDWSDSAINSAKITIRNVVRDSYDKAISKGLDMVKEELKDSFKQISDAVSDKIKDAGKQAAKKVIQKAFHSVIPAGLPILPPFGWWCTVNAWAIDVRGDIPVFEVTDMGNYPGQHSLFGHESQRYMRKDYEIWIDLDGDGIDDTLLGKNTPIHFQYTTGTFIIVPPGGTGVGDRTGGWVEHEGYP